MTATAAATAAPAYAVLLWCDLRTIYVQFPAQNGPCVVSFPRDSGGLSKALDLLKSRHAVEGAGAVYTQPAPPFKPSVAISPNSRDVVREMLRRKGILGAKP
jgi:hypothetical protein